MKRSFLITFASMLSLTLCQAQTPGSIAIRTNAFTKVDPPSLYRDRPELGTIQTAQFSLTYDNFVNFDGQNACLEATKIWGYILNSRSPMPITIKVRGAALPDTNTLMATAVGHFVLKSTDTTLYPQALAKAKGGTEWINITQIDSDIVVTVNSYYTNGGRWYFGTDGHAERDKFDFLSIMLHELAHGLGFVRTFDVPNNGQMGRRGFTPYGYDRYCINGPFYGFNRPESLLFRFPDSSLILGQALRSNNIYFGGENSWIMGNRTTVPKLFAPSTFSPGSSIAHLDSLTYQKGSPNSLMHPGFQYAEAVHSPGEFGLAMLQDVGWEINRLITFTRPLSNQSVVRGDSIELVWTDNQIGTVLADLMKRQPSGTYSLEAFLGAVSSSRGTNPAKKLLIPATVDSGMYKIRFMDETLGQGYGATFDFRVTRTGQVEKPVLFPPGNTYFGNINVAATTATQGAVVRFDTTGAEPTENSQVYPVGGVDITSSKAIRAKGFKPPLYASSETAMETYTISSVAGVSTGPIPTSSKPNPVRFDDGRYNRVTGTTYPYVGRGVFIPPQQSVARTFLQWNSLPSQIVPDSITSATLEITPDNLSGTLTVSLKRTKGDILSDSTLWNSTSTVVPFESSVSFGSGRFQRPYYPGSPFVDALKDGLRLDRSLQIAVSSNNETQAGTWVEIASASLTITYKERTVRVAQIDSAGFSFGQWGRWESNQWRYHPDTTMVRPTSATFTLRADTNFKPATTQKYNVWRKNNSNTQDSVVNHANIPVDASVASLIANFKPSKPAIIQAQLIEGGFTGGTINFKDPWLVDNSDSKGPKNRGVNAIWHNGILSPFKPETSATYKGVFLDQPIESGKPYYSVGAPLQQTINGVPGSFQYWTWSNASLRSATKETSAVVFQQSGAATTAMYKGYLLSSQSNATGFSNQRKLAVLNGVTYAVYPSAGSIWFTKNNGSGWSGEKLIRQATSARNPSIAVSVFNSTTCISVVWNEDYNGHSYIFFARSSDYGGNWSVRGFVEYTLPLGSVIAPVVAASSDNAVVVWQCAQGLAYKVKPIASSYPEPSGILRQTDANTTSPSIEGSSGFKIVYSQSGDIKYDEFAIALNQIDLYYPLPAPEPVSVFQYTGSSPTIAYKGDAAPHHVLVAWNVSPQIYLRERIGGVWQTVDYVTSLGSNAQGPVASYEDNTARFYVLWQSDTHVEKTSRPLNGSSWRTPVNLGTGTSPSVPSALLNYYDQSTALWTVGAGAFYEIHPATFGAPHLQSFTANATATGSQRKLVRNTADGRMYLTYESDGDIFATRSSDNGATWEAEQCVSKGFINCSAPSIAERRGTVYIVWQKGTGPNYDIMFSVSANFGISWSNAVTLQSVQCLNDKPNPVVAATPEAGGPISLMVVYKGNDRLLSAYTTVGVPNTRDWLFEQVRGTDKNSRDPSLACTPASYPPLHLSWADGAQIYFQNYYPGSWQQPTIVNKGIAGSVYENFYPTLAFTEKQTAHIAWQGIRPPWREIIHNYDLNPSVFTEFVYPKYGDFDSPSISGLAGDGAMLLWHFQDNQLLKAIYRDGNWTKVDKAGVSGISPSTSVSNPPGAQPFFVYSGVSGPLYPLGIRSTEGFAPLSSSNENSIAASLRRRRLIITSRNNNESLALEIETPILENTPDSVLTFVPLNDTVRYDPQTAWSLMETPVYNVGDLEFPLRVQHAVRGMRSRNVRTPILNIPVVLEIVHAATNVVLAQELIQPVASDSGTTLRGTTRLRPSISLRTPIKFRLRLQRAFPHQLFQAAVVNVYEMDVNAQTLMRSSVAKGPILIPTRYELHPNYPNPFNPSTTINYDLPEPGTVSLVVYDILGRKVTELVNGMKEAGYHSALWNASEVASGVYFARFTATDAGGNVKLSKINKLLLMK